MAFESVFVNHKLKHLCRWFASPEGKAWLQVKGRAFDNPRYHNLYRVSEFGTSLERCFLAYAPITDSTLYVCTDVEHQLIGEHYSKQLGIRGIFK